MPFPEVLNWTLPGEGFPKASEFETIALDIPVKLGLIGAYFTSAYTADPLYNYADPSKPLKVIGKPLLEGPYAICSATNCFDTGIPSQSTMSAISIAARSSSPITNEQGLICSSFDGDVGDSLRITDKAVVANTSVDTGFTTATTDIMNVPDTDFVIATAQFNPGRSVAGHYDPTVKDIRSTSSIGQGRRLSSNTILFGGHHSPMAFNGWVKVSSLLLFNRTLTVDEYKLICAHLRFNFGPQFLLW